MSIYARMILFFLILVFTANCGKLIGTIRKDLDDSDEVATSEPEDIPPPTKGGRWAERGYLNDQVPGSADYSSLNHTDRRPSNEDPSNGVRQSPWISTEDSEMNRQDMNRHIYNYPEFKRDPSTATTSKLDPDTKRLYKSGNRATRDDFIDQSQEEGSLWASNGDTNYYFIKNKVRSPGDMITLVIEPDLYKDIGNEIKQMLSFREKSTEVGIIQDRLKEKFLAELEASRKDTLATTSAAPDRTLASSSSDQTQPSPAPAPRAIPEPLTQEQINRMVPKANFADVDIFPSLDFKAGDTMMGEILERYPNGNFKVKAVKRIPYKKGSPRIVTVVGIVRAADINTETDTINSGKLYEYRVEVAH